MRATIKVVAKLADVSTATVSHFITKKKYVSEELSQRINEAMHTLGYKPNTIARSLKIKRSYIIGVVVPSISNPFFAEIVEQIQKIAGKYAYRIMLYDSNNDVTAEKQIMDSFLSAGVDGIIDVASLQTEEQLGKTYGVPVVITDRPPFETKSNIGFVYADNNDGAAQVADFLVSHGYNRFAYFAGPVDKVPNARERLYGFTERLVELGIGKDLCKVYYGEYSFDSGYETMRRLLTEWDITQGNWAVFAPSDIMAWGAMESAKTQGLKIPRDIALVGFDNIFYSNYLYPALTTVENPTKELGEKSVRLIIQAIDNHEQLSGQKVILNASLIERKSTIQHRDM